MEIQLAQTVWQMAESIMENYLEQVLMLYV